MGKNSLLKSTAKTKKKTKPKAAAKAKASSKVKADVNTKAAKKAKGPAKTEAASKAKAAPKAKAAARAKKPAPKTKKKKVSMKELIHKKFGTWKPDKLYTVSPDEKYLKGFAAPPFASGSEEDTRRIKELLLKKFDIAEIKAAAEKAAAEKAAEPEVSVSYEPPVDTDTTVSDPMEKAMKYLVAVIVVLVVIVVGSSMINKTKYYMNEKQGALEIWQGRFAPMGEELMITLPGVQLPETIKDVYLKKDVFPLIFNYYMEKADMLLEVPGIPDFEAIKGYLNKALSYAVTSASTETAYNRLNNIELMILFYKADVAAGKATLAGLKDAKDYLDQATALSTNDLQADMINQKINAVDKQIATLKATEKEAKSPAPAHSAE